MTPELNRVEALPVRKPGVPTDEPLGTAAPVVRLTCPSCSAELTSLVDHAIAPVQAGGAPPVTWTSEAAVVAATLKALRASIVVAPAVEAPALVAPVVAPAVVAPAVVAPAVEAPAPVEDTSSSRKPSHLRLLPPSPQDLPDVDTAPDVADATPTEDVTVEAANQPPAVSTRRRRQGFFSRVLTVRTFRVERDVARGSRNHEAAVTALLDGAAGEGVLSLHHHRLPGRRAEVAHVAIGASGVFVIDVRHLKEDGRVPDAIATVRAQVAALRSTLAAVELHDVRVEGLLCLGGKNGAAVPAANAEASEASEASEVRVVSPDDLTSLVTVTGPLTDDDRVTLIEFLRT